MAESGIDAAKSHSVGRAPRKALLDASRIRSSAYTAIAAAANTDAATLALKNARVDKATTWPRPSLATRVISGWNASTGMAMKRLAKRAMRDATWKSDSTSSASTFDSTQRSASLNARATMLKPTAPHQ